MKRDMDLVRKILIKLEDYSPDDEINQIECEGYSPEETAYHVYLLKDAHLIIANIFMNNNSIGPKEYKIYGLTWAGHDFLEASRDETRWKQAKEVVIKMGSGASFDVLKSVLVQIMMAQIPKIIGTGV